MTSTPEEEDLATRGSLRLSAENAAAFFDAMPMPCWVVDHGGRIVSANPAAARLLGLDQTLLAHRSMEDFLTGSDHGTWRGRVERVFEGHVVSGSLGLVTRLGQVVPATVQLAAIGAVAGAGPCCLVSVPETAVAIEEELVREKERAERYLAIAGTMIVALDREGRIDLINRKGCDVLGWSEAQLIGRDWFATVVPEESRAWARDLHELVVAGRMEPGPLVESETLTRDGSRRLMAWSITVVRDGSGAITGTLSSGEDITERRQALEALREGEEKVRLLLDSAGVGIYGVDRDGICTICNPACVRMLGYQDAEDLIGRDIHDVMHHTHINGHSYPAAECRMREVARTGQAVVYDDEVFWRADGTCFPVEYHAYPVRRDGRLMGAVVSFRDITKRKKTEAALREAKEEAESANRAKNDFLASMSYDLRTPLNDIIGFTDMILAEIFGPLEHAQYKDYIQDIGKSGRRLLEIINDLLDLSRLEAALQKGERSYRQLVELAPDCICVVYEGVITLVNSTGVAMLGAKSADELIGREIADLVDQGSRVHVTENLHQLMAEHTRVPVRFIRLDGQAVETEASALSFDDERGDAIMLVARDVTERKRAERAARESEERFRTALENAADAIFIHDLDGRILDINDHACSVLGYSREELLALDMCSIEQTLDKREARAMWRGLGSETLTIDGIHQRSDGTCFPVEVHIDQFGSGNQRMIIALARDVTERKRAEDVLRLAATVFETTTEAIMVTDAENRVKAVNPAFTRITGYSVVEILGRNPNILASGRHDRGFYEDMWRRLSETGHWEGEIWNRRRSGEIYPEWLSIATIFDDDGAVVERVALFTDITKRKKDEEQIRRQANFDALTGLPNRTLFLDRLSRAIAQSKREARTVGLLFVDLDRFKTVNDSLGHIFGDRLLEQVAGRLTGCVREADTVARLGGDEFTIILADIRREQDAATVAEKIIERLGQPFMIEGHDLFIGASVGITIFPTDADDAATMLRNADIAMYRAKEAGRNGYRFFTPEMNTHAVERMRLERDLRRALERGQFSLHYQPIVDLDSGEVVSAEALIRWHHPERGTVAPDQFIPLAEETGMIGPIGEWVIWTACAQAKRWHDAGHDRLGVSVNLSSRQLKLGLTVETVKRALTETGIDPKRLTFEITESMLMDDTEHSIAWLNSIKALGINLSIDDFGTGYSSLSYLKRFPVDTVKIDRSFVRDITDDPEDAALVSAIIAMTHSLHMRVVGEGGETEDQVEFLRKQGCKLVQGFFYGRPEPPEVFSRRLPRNPGGGRGKRSG